MVLCGVQLLQYHKQLPINLDDTTPQWHIFILNVLLLIKINRIICAFQFEETMCETHETYGEYRGKGSLGPAKIIQVS